MINNKKTIQCKKMDNVHDEEIYDRRNPDG